jgi:hypothetical protein
MERAGDVELRESVIATLGGDAMTLAALRARLGPPWDRPAGGDGDDLDRLLQRDTAFTMLTDGIVFVPTLLEGTAWTVRIDPDDGAEGFVRMNPELSALGWWLIGDDVALVDGDGSRLGVLETSDWTLDGVDTDVVLGPDGWLDGLVGGWARIDVVDGALRWSPLDRPPAATPAQIAAVRAGVDRAARDSDSHRTFEPVPMPDGLRFATGARPIHEALLADPSAFRGDPIPPLTELYAAAGLVERNGIIAVAGFDWDALHAWQTRCQLVIYHGLDPAQADGVAEFLAVYDASSADDAVDIVGVIGALDDGAVATVVWEELAQRDARVEDLARLVAASAAEERSIGFAWLRARVLDRSGDTAAAVDVLEAAVDSTCRHGKALVDLAGLRADRGDASGALRLLVQAGVGPDRDDDDEWDDERDEWDDERDRGELLWDEVEGFATHRPRPKARRNDPCPCGSGRKYKACHLGREAHSLDDRAGWLYQKALRFLRDRSPLAVEQLAELVVDEFDQPSVFAALADGPFLTDVVLHEEGVFDEFLAARDRLLPDDEALLAAQWALVDRGVFEVIETTGTQLVLRAVAGGDHIRVVNTHPSDRVRAGMLLVGRPLPVGETHRAFSGFFPLAPGHQDAMLAAIDSRDSEEIADVLAAILAPPRLTNTDGENLVAHTITWHVPQPDAVDTALVAAGLRADGEDHWTLVRDSKNMDDTVIASIRLDGKELTVDVNSVERAAELERLVAGALPDAEVVDVDARPFEMPDEPVRTSEMRPADHDDPAIRAVLAEHVAAYERRWLDESIPALGGRTPREAAGDPIGREELNRLLASFPLPGPDDVGVMDPDRLRAALGL